MREYLIDLSGMNEAKAGIEELHERLAGALEAPDWYGHNLDALYDILTGMEGVITVRGFEDAEKALGGRDENAPEGYAGSLRRVLLDAEKENARLKIVFEGPRAEETDVDGDVCAPCDPDDPDDLLFI